VIRELRPKYPDAVGDSNCQLLACRALVFTARCAIGPERARFYRELTFEIGQVLSSESGLWIPSGSPRDR